MSNSETILVCASSEFIDLCQSQMALLHQGLNADWIGVYLTEELTPNDNRLIPFLVYPQTETDGLIPDLVTLSTHLQPPLLLGNGEVQKIKNFDFKDNSLSSQPHNLVLPLIYQDLVMGVLVTQRQESQWNPLELKQIEKIAHTIAIARCLDQRQSWYHHQLNEQANIRQIAKNRLDDFLHQLRNPLTALQTFTKLLLKRLLPEDENRDIVNYVLHESKHLQELVAAFEEQTVSTSSVVNLVPILSDSPTSVTPKSFLISGDSLSLTPISIQEVLAPLLLASKTIAFDQNVDLLVNIPQKLPLVKGNIQALTEVFNNLIDNAIKYTPSGGKVKIDFLAKKELLAIIISDTGYGISKEDQAHIFERHYRGEKEQTTIPGTGLGLAIAKELVEQMEGKIEVISPNKISNNNRLPGTTFMIWLKIANSYQHSVV